MRSCRSGRCPEGPNAVLLQATAVRRKRGRGRGAIARRRASTAADAHRDCNGHDHHDRRWTGAGDDPQDCRHGAGTLTAHSPTRARRRQRLAPEQLVIPPERWTERVRISSRRCVGPEVERDIDRLAQTHLSTVHPESLSGVRSHQIAPARPATTAPCARPWSEHGTPTGPGPASPLDQRVGAATSPTGGVATCAQN